jgi:hypothetical protein
VGRRQSWKPFLDAPIEQVTPYPIDANFSFSRENFPESLSDDIDVSSTATATCLHGALVLEQAFMNHKFLQHKAL